MMTWTSERSGIASSGMCVTEYQAPASANIVATKTIIRLRAQKSIIACIIKSGFSLSVPGMFAHGLGSTHTGNRGLEPAFRINQKIGAGEDSFTLVQAGENFHQFAGGAADSHRARL